MILRRQWLRQATWIPIAIQTRTERAMPSTPRPQPPGRLGPSRLTALADGRQPWKAAVAPPLSLSTCSEQSRSRPTCRRPRYRYRLPGALEVAGQRVLQCGKPARRRETDLLLAGRWGGKLGVDRLITRGSGDTRVDTSVGPARKPLRHIAESGNYKVGTHGRHFACAPAQKKAHCRRFACRRRDSNPRHADYDDHQGSARKLL